MFFASFVLTPASCISTTGSQSFT